MEAKWRAPSDISKRGGSQPLDKRAAGGHSVNLEDQAEHWKAPNVPTGGRSITHAQKLGSSYYDSAGQKVQFGLERQVENWAAPQARDHFPAHTPEYIAAKKAIGHGMRNLNDETEHWQAPAQITWAQALAHLALALSPARVIQAGPNCSPPIPSCAPPSQKRKLNPLFVEALMRWPTGLSGFERAEMALTQWRQQQLSYLSALCFQKRKKAA